MCERYMFRGVKAKLSEGERRSFRGRKMVFWSLKHIYISEMTDVKWREKSDFSVNLRSKTAVSEMLNQYFRFNISETERCMFHIDY